jgi:DNA-binding beta-propeller fold protein YncE
LIQSGSLVWLGTFGGDFEESVAGIVSIDLTDGSAESYRLPGVTIGKVGEEDLGDESAPEIVDPALVGDPAGHRVLVVHADRLAVTEVDLMTGEVAEHDLSSSASWLGRLFTWLVPPATADGGGPSFGTTKSAVLSPSGERLYVASARSEVVWDDDGEWEVVTIPQGVQAIDTVTWEMAARWDVPASTVAVSPDGNYLVATGTTMIDRLSITDFRSEGVFVIDTMTDELIGHLEGPNEFPEVHFSPDDDYLYIVGSGGGRIDIVDLATLEITDTVVGPEQLTVFGDVPLLVTGLR